MTITPPSSAAPTDREIAERIALEHDWGALGAPMTLAAEIERALSDARAATERETVERINNLRVALSTVRDLMRNRADPAVNDRLAKTVHNCAVHALDRGATLSRPEPQPKKEAPSE